MLCYFLLYRNHFLFITRTLLPMNQIIMKHQVTSREMKCDLPVNKAKSSWGRASSGTLLKELMGKVLALQYIIQ